MNPHAEVGELSSILSTCEYGVRWLKTLKAKLAVIHHLRRISLLQENGHDKREAAYQKPNTVLICTVQKMTEQRPSAQMRSWISLKVDKTPSMCLL